MSKVVKRAFRYRFKNRKRSRRSAEYTRSAFRWRGGRLTLAKMTEPLRIVWSRPLPDSATPSTVTVSQDRAKPARAQRNLARKEKGSANRARARLKVARVHARIADRRRDHPHKLSTRLVRENQTIVIEDLTVRTMLKNHFLARAISDVAWRQFRTMLEYKAEWHQRDLAVIDRWFPSSKLCSACGRLAEKMPLHVRTWSCGCGVAHDREVNAARNILAEGLSVLACGDDVRPRPGRSPVKQETRRVTAGIPGPHADGGGSHLTAPLISPDT